MFGRKNKRLLKEAREEIASLQSELTLANETTTHLRHLLDLKSEECGALASRVDRMRERVEFADAVEEKFNEIESKLDEFATVKKNLERRIEVLRMERDEARALIKARGEREPAIDFIDMTAIREKPVPQPEKRRVKSIKEMPGDKDNVDWYEPLGDI